jgi:hypothetical protein
MKTVHPFKRALTNEEKYTMNTKSITVLLAILTSLVLGYAPFSSAAEGKSLEQMITEAKTPADHEAIAAYYEKEAHAAHQQHAEHKTLVDFHATRPALKTKSRPLFARCHKIAKKYEEIAKEHEAMAHMHRDMAKAAR